MNKGISRREALKRIGMVIAGATVSSTGLSTLSACSDPSEKRRIILYFTATGNCLYAARQIARPDDQLLSIPQMGKESRYDFEADEIGIVYPVFGHMPPNTVREFIRKARLKADYKKPIINSPFLLTAHGSATRWKYGTAYRKMPATGSTISPP